MIIKVPQIQYNKTIGLWLLFLIFSCQENENITTEANTALVVDFSDLTLEQNKGIYTYNSLLFTGVAESFHPNGMRFEEIHFTNGKKNGPKKIWFENGHISYEGYYLEGKLDGTARTWWNNDTLRSESNYKNGKVHGKQLQWYSSGAKFKELNIFEGQEVGMQKAWRENGEIYNNYEAKDGRIFGLKRATMCFTLEDEEVILD